MPYPCVPIGNCQSCPCSVTVASRTSRYRSLRHRTVLPPDQVTKLYAAPFETSLLSASSQFGLPSMTERPTVFSVYECTGLACPLVANVVSRYRSYVARTIRSRFGLAAKYPAAVKSAPTPRSLDGPAIELFLVNNPIPINGGGASCPLISSPRSLVSSLLFSRVRGSLGLTLLESVASKNVSWRIMSPFI